jgi:hypothetical protein
VAIDEDEEDLISEDGSDIEEEVDGVADLGGLLEKLRELSMCGEKFTEITYLVNDWTLGGVLPMQHHGLRLKTSSGEYLTLDFCRQGIDWWFGDEAPEEADGTFLVLQYKTQADPLVLLDYCAASEPFSWLANNCKTWSEGVLQLFNLKDAPCEDISPGLLYREDTGEVLPAKTCYALNESKAQAIEETIRQNQRRNAAQGRTACPVKTAKTCYQDTHFSFPDTECS